MLAWAQGDGGPGAATMVGADAPSEAPGHPQSRPMSLRM
jgi:hypothetical protein